MGAVVGGGGAEFDSELDAGAGGQLVGVHPGAEPRLDARFEDRARPVAVERAALAERVHPAGVRRGRRQHVAAHECDVVVGVHAVGYHVRAEERGLVAELAGDP